MILAVDATTKTASCALYNHNQIVALYTLNNGYTHSETLLPLIDKTLRQRSVKVADLEAIIVANGPGSFTGIRIALATVKGLAHPFNTAIYTVSTLRSLSYHGHHFDGVVCPILDARRNQVYSAVYAIDGEEILKPSTYKIEALCEWLKDKTVLFVGDGVTTYQDYIKENLEHNALCGQLDKLNNTAIGLVHAHLSGYSKQWDYRSVPVAYLRKPQAEREREARLNEV